MARRGRKRNLDAKRRQTTTAGRRGDNVIPIEVLRQRAERAGTRMEDATDAKAGTVLGAMLLRKHITWAEYQAGESFGRLCVRYSRMVESPDATARAMPLPYRTDNEPPALSGHELDAVLADLEVTDEERWPKISAAYRGAIQHIHALPAGRYAHCMLVKACVTEDMVDAGQMAGAKRALAALAALWNIQDEREDMDVRRRATTTT